MSSSPSTHIRRSQLHSCNSSSREADVFFWLPWAPIHLWAYSYKHIHINKNKSLLKNSRFGKLADAKHRSNNQYPECLVTGVSGFRLFQVLESFYSCWHYERPWDLGVSMKVISVWYACYSLKISSLDNWSLPAFGCSPSGEISYGFSSTCASVLRTYLQLWIFRWFSR